MASRPKDFRPRDKRLAMLWCARHCCWCGKFCGVNIELAHIDRDGSRGLENAIPLCFDCHASIEHYDSGHPRGTRPTRQEKIARRDQTYAKHTSHLLAPVDYRLSQQTANSRRTFPDIGFVISHLGGPYGIKAQIRIILAKGGRSFGCPTSVGHYNGKLLWNLNPRQTVFGHFSAPTNLRPERKKPLRARVEVTLVDLYEYHHKLLPVGFVLEDSAQEWYAEPCRELMGALRR